MFGILLALLSLPIIGLALAQKLGNNRAEQPQGKESPSIVGGDYKTVGRIKDPMDAKGKNLAGQVISTARDMSFDLLENADGTEVPKFAVYNKNTFRDAFVTYYHEVTGSTPATDEINHAFDLASRESGVGLAVPNGTYGIMYTHERANPHGYLAARARVIDGKGGHFFILKGKDKETVSTAIGIGQLLGDWWDKYAPDGRAGIGDERNEFISWIRYVLAAHKTFAVADARQRQGRY